MFFLSDGKKKIYIYQTLMYIYDIPTIMYLNLLDICLCVRKPFYCVSALIKIKCRVQAIAVKNIILICI